MERFCVRFTDNVRIDQMVSNLRTIWLLREDTMSILQLRDQDQSGFWFDKALDPVAYAELHAVLKAHERHFEAGNLLKVEADESHSIYVMLKGWAASSKSLSEGQTQIIDFSLPGDFSNLLSADGKTAAIGFEVITDATTIAVVPLEEWWRLEKSLPQFSKVSQTGAAATRSRIAERVLRLGRCSAEERLAYAFLELGVRTGAMLDGNINCFHLPITQQQLGDFMGLTSVHVCRTLRRMARHGLISTADHIDLCVLDVAALEELAGISIDALARKIIPPD